MRMKCKTGTGLPVKIIANKVVFDFRALLKILTHHPSSIEKIQKIQKRI